jgi:hypothetical protein
MRFPSDRRRALFYKCLLTSSFESDDLAQIDSTDIFVAPRAGVQQKRNIDAFTESGHKSLPHNH